MEEVGGLGSNFANIKEFLNTAIHEIVCVDGLALGRKSIIQAAIKMALQ
jgi:hypothetical protein